MSEECGNDLEKLRREALEIKDEYNKRFEENFGKSLHFVIRKERFGEKALGLQVRINWKNFYKFLDDFAKSDASLEVKYEYLFLCRSSLAWMKSPPREDQMKDSVKMFAESEIQEINRVIDQFIDALNTLKDKMRRRHLSLARGPLSKNAVATRDHGKPKPFKFHGEQPEKKLKQTFPTKQA